MQKKHHISLSPEERAWLAQAHAVRVRVLNYPPYIILKGGGEPRGIAIDYLELIAERTGVNFQYIVSGKSFPDALEGLKNHQGPDLISTMMRTPEREEAILFSRDYNRSPFVIYINADIKEFISDIADLGDRKIALPRGTVIHEDVKRAYPDLDLVLFDNDAQAIAAVATEKADAYIGDLTLASYLIMEKGLANLKIAGPTPFGDHVHSMGIRNDWPELRGIIDKALDTITLNEEAAIRNRYVSIHFEHGIRAGDVVKWIIIVVASTAGILSLFVLWNKSLKSQVQERTVDLEIMNQTLEQEVEERRRAEEKLRYQAALLENVSDAVVSIDLNYSVVSWNKAAELIYGWSAEEASGKLLRDLTSIEYLDESRDYVLNEIRKTGQWRGEIIQRRKDGEHLVVQTTASFIKDDQGQPAGIVAVFRDITEQKKAQVVLAESELRFRSTFEQAAVGIAHVSMDGRFLRVNRKFCDISGYSHEEMLNLTFQDVIHLDDLAAHLDYVRKLLDSEEDSYSLEKKHLRKDGQTVWINLTVSLVRGDTGKPDYFVSVIEDITVRKQAEVKIQAYQERLKALASQLTIAEEKERGRIAAELHDHVGQTLAVSRILVAQARKYAPEGQLATILDEISQSLLSTIQETKELVFDLSSPLLNEVGLAAATSNWLEEQLSRKHGIKTKFIHDATVLSLGNEMKTILFRNVRELLANVVKHAQASKVIVSLEKNGAELTLSVLDDGVGFNASEERQRDDTKFGLFSISERMEDFGGSLEVISQPGEGCQAILRVPVDRDDKGLRG